jgi:oligopeptide/dipeptide ABC transporter ATP-binding protein
VSATNGTKLFEVRDLEKHFPLTSGVIFRKTVGAVRAVDGVSFDVFEGETLGLVGESGCGKSTTARLITRLLEPTGGQVIYKGEDISHRSRNDLKPLRRDMQMIFQDPYSSLNPRKTVGSIIGEPFVIHDVERDEDKRKRRVQELMDLVGLNPEHYNRFPHEFSGGQRQRIGVARAIALKPKLVVADEPVSALDVSIQAQIINLLENLQSEFDLTYLFIAHDLAVVRHISDRIAVMYLGSIVEVSPADELYDSPLHPYTISLLSAVPIPDPEVERQRETILLAGDLPSPANPPPACRFHTRCPYIQPTRCTTDAPPLRRLHTGHFVACHWAEQIKAGEIRPQERKADDISAPPLPADPYEPPPV